MLIRKTLYAFLTPPNLFFLLLLLVCLCYYKRWARRCLFYTTLCFIALSTPLVANKLHNQLNRYPALSPADIQATQAQAIVLLSGGIYGYSPEFQRNMPSASSMLRATYAARLARQTGLPLLVSGGGRRGDSPPGGAIIQNFLQIELNTPVRWVETQSKTTWDNALYSRALLNNFAIERIILVSESWHLPRAVSVFEYQGFSVTPAPTFASKSSYEFSWLDTLVPTAYDFRRSQTALHEIFGMLWYKIERLGEQRGPASR